MADMSFEPLEGACFGARVRNVTLTDLDEKAFRTLYDHWLDAGLLVVGGQFLGRDDQIAFAKRFGDLEFEMAEIGNMRKDGTLRPDDGSDDMMKVNRGNMGWHHDSTYMPVQAKGAVFSAEIVPDEGGATGFADMRAAYDALDEVTRAKIENLRAHHSLYHSQAKVGHDAKPVKDASVNTDDTATDQKGKTYGGYGFHDGPVSVRPLVKVHPETGYRNLIIGRHAYDIIGMSSEESEKLLQELVDFACQPPRVYHHQWEPGDVVIWDNRRLMHQATPWNFKQARRMWHSRIAGDPETEAAMAA
ncbi:TauD/TfdA dioxygenase family protein [Minwuia sp.]|uniref:TauD/TfdA dioxygenase family protein n=1 Tax=Minwuia sp. TaxID=2493630 RepID=UPI003A8D2A9C